MTIGNRWTTSALLLALAAMTTACSGQGVTLRGPYGLLGLIILAFQIWAIVQIIQGSQPTGAKVLWILVILLLPVLGVILWYLLGRK